MDEPEEDLVELRGPSGGTAPVAHGTQRYLPYTVTKDPEGQWHVRVPREAAAHLIRTGGYEMVDTPEKSDDDTMARVYHPDHPKGQSLSWAPPYPGMPGKNFAAGSGSVTVDDVTYVVTEIPLAALDAASSFGFKPAPLPQEAAPKSEDKPPSPPARHR